MVPDRQKGSTDGRNGRTDGQRQNYIPPTSSEDNNETDVFLLLIWVLIWVQVVHKDNDLISAYSVWAFFSNDLIERMQKNPNFDKVQNS